MELLLLLLPLLLLPWIGPERRVGRIVGRASGAAGGQNQKCPTNGQGGYITPAVSGSPSASERGTKSEVAHLWARWLHNPCRVGEPLRFTAGDKIKSCPQMGKVAT